MVIYWDVWNLDLKEVLVSHDDNIQCASRRTDVWGGVGVTVIGGGERKNEDSSFCRHHWYVNSCECVEERKTESQERKFSMCTVNQISVTVPTKDRTYLVHWIGLFKADLFFFGLHEFMKNWTFLNIVFQLCILKIYSLQTTCLTTAALRNAESRNDCE